MRNIYIMAYVLVFSFISAGIVAASIHPTGHDKSCIVLAGLAAVLLLIDLANTEEIELI